MKSRALRLCILLALLSFPSRAQEQERRAYEGVVSLRKKTIGALILLEVNGDSVAGWIRLGKFVPIEGGTISPERVEFQAGGNRYSIDERRGKISYSGPDGEGNRYIAPLSRLTGQLEALTEGEQFSGNSIATVEVRGRRWNLAVHRPSLWKRQGPPFETFSRPEELLQREIAVWVADAEQRRGKIVVIEEPEGINIPLKPPKKSK
ncbi:MAG: hypothetical protein HY651_07945 [Acidobacteria bacterium]|nr:hypothetical protein [Acidobacteriota bacterium]